MIQTHSATPVHEPLTPSVPKRTDPLPPFKPMPVRVPAPAPLPNKKPTFQPDRVAPTHAPPDGIPKPLQPFCPVPDR